MKQQVIEALRKSRYRVISQEQDLEEVFRLRYQCYRAEKTIARNERCVMSDAFDHSENCVHVGVEFEGRIEAAIRLHLVSLHGRTSPSLEVFPEILQEVEQGKTVLDTTRFVIAPTARKERVPLNFLVLRIPFLATMFYGIDVALAAVRAEHVPFYRRYLGYDAAIEPRAYPGLKKPIQLLTANVAAQRDAVLARTPVFGPLDNVPFSNISFPEVPGFQSATNAGQTEVA
jgi:N-acyl-L-homoserine lactone synthetase